MFFFSIRVLFQDLKSSTGKNNGFPFLDILGYLKNTHKNPIFGKVRQFQPGNSQPSYLIGTCLTLPNLGFLWVFFKYSKISINGNLLFFPVMFYIYTLSFANICKQEKVLIC